MKKRNQVGTIGRVEKTGEHFMSSTGGKSIFKKPTASGRKETPFAVWESIIQASEILLIISHKKNLTSGKSRNITNIMESPNMDITNLATKVTSNIVTNMEKP